MMLDQIPAANGGTPERVLDINKARTPVIITKILSHQAGAQISGCNQAFRDSFPQADQGQDLKDLFTSPQGEFDHDEYGKMLKILNAPLKNGKMEDPQNPVVVTFPDQNSGQKLHFEVVPHVLENNGPTDQSVLAEMTNITMFVEKIKSMQQENAIDPTTQVFGKIMLQEELDCLKNNNSPYGLIVIDLDHFRNVNNEFGHVVGDKALQITGTILQNSIRRDKNREGNVLGRDEVVIRYGGDEFIIILPGCSRDGINVVMERINERLRIYNENRNDTQEQKKVILPQISLSMGGIHSSELEPDEDPIQKADERMYQKKYERRVEYFKKKFPLILKSEQYRATFNEAVNAISIMNSKEKLVTPPEKMLKEMMSIATRIVGEYIKNCGDDDDNGGLTELTALMNLANRVGCIPKPEEATSQDNDPNKI